eukprot:PhF_6_TR4419/c0_g1_i1/m.5975
MVHRGSEGTEPVEIVIDPSKFKTEVENKHLAMKAEHDVTIKWKTGITICDIMSCRVGPKYYQHVLSAAIQSLDRIIRFSAYARSEVSTRESNKAIQKNLQ